jgi:putative chitinase
LFRLSLTYGLTINEIAAANGITNIQLIIVGQRLTIPGCGTTGAVPPPTTVPTAAPVPTTTTGTTDTTVPTVPTTGGRTHIVQEGETLFEIAQLYGVTVDAIVQANGIVDPNLILMTTELVIPGG